MKFQVKWITNQDGEPMTAPTWVSVDADSPLDAIEEAWGAEPGEEYIVRPSNEETTYRVQCAKVVLEKLD